MAEDEDELQLGGVPEAMPPAEEDEAAEVGHSDEEALKGSEEEEREEQWDAAARFLQGLYRARKARRLLLELALSSYAKEIDPETGLVVYRNKVNNQVTQEKPLILGTHDVPTPRAHAMPLGYKPRPFAMRHFAMVVTNAQFESPKLPNIDPRALQDHEELEWVLTNPLLCQCHTSDFVSLRNSSKSGVLQGLDTIKRRMESASEKAPGAENSFVMYITTHAITSKSGFSSRTYLACYDTIYQSQATISKTSISLDELAESLSSLPCAHKTILLDAVHVPRPQSTILRTKFLSPSGDLLVKFARSASVELCLSVDIFSKHSHRAAEADQPSKDSRRGKEKVHPTTEHEEGANAGTDPEGNASVKTSETGQNEGGDGASGGASDTQRSSSKRSWRLSFKRSKKRASTQTTQEVAQYMEQGSVFGQACARGLAGGASDYRLNNRITCQQLVAFCQEFAMAHAQHAMQRPTCVHGTPLDGPKSVLATIPSVPPKPSEPRAIRIKLRSILLEWTVPKYSGDPPCRYEIQMCGVAKYNRTWKVLAPYATIRKTQFLACHLTTGLEHKFRVRALNQGGWSEFSDESDLYIPASAPPVTLRERVKQAARSGVPSLLSFMKENITDDEAIKLGCWMLNKHATLHSGFTRGSTGTAIVQVALESMKLFPSNSTLQSMALLVIGWACFDHPGTAKEAEKLGAFNLIETARRAFPADSGIHGNSLWAVSNLRHSSETPADAKRAIQAWKSMYALQYKYLT